jgi:hypothetical protein
MNDDPKNFFIFSLVAIPSSIIFILFFLEAIKAT